MRYEYCTLLPSESGGFVVRGDADLEVAYDRSLLSVLNMMGREGWSVQAHVFGGFVLMRGYEDDDISPDA